MNEEAIRRIRDTAVELGASCNSDCYFNPEAGSEFKSYVQERAMN